MASVRVIGCGNPDAGDDAVGLLAVRHVRPRLEALAGVDVVETGPAIRVLDLLSGIDGAVVVDAVHAPSGGRVPGELVRAEAGPEGLPADVGSSLSSHGLGVGEAVGLAAALDRAPRIVFLGVEAGDFVAGHPVSRAVARSMPELGERIVAEAQALAEAREER